MTVHHYYWWLWLSSLCLNTLALPYKYISVCAVPLAVLMCSISSITAFVVSPGLFPISKNVSTAVEIDSGITFGTSLEGWGRGSPLNSARTGADWDGGGGLRCCSGNTACGCSRWSVINTGVKARGHGLKHTRACRINTHTHARVWAHTTVDGKTPQDS